ncbi:hypothetical protein [Burkholderia sp. JKS000303]|uniref:hypothetical protein n=1 Tax=Burkholderia sp. JKS000303 TaxID=1938747 RepID=UPI0011814EAD|nr:hypothetical protein [Burkholderia sp. JKS000303]
MQFRPPGELPCPATVERIGSMARDFFVLRGFPWVSLVDPFPSLVLRTATSVFNGLAALRARRATPLVELSVIGRPFSLPSMVIDEWFVRLEKPVRTQHLMVEKLIRPDTSRRFDTPDKASEVQAS